MRARDFLRFLRLQGLKNESDLQREKIDSADKSAMLQFIGSQVPTLFAAGTSVAKQAIDADRQRAIESLMSNPNLLLEGQDPKFPEPPVNLPDIDAVDVKRVSAVPEYLIAKKDTPTSKVYEQVPAAGTLIPEDRVGNVGATKKAAAAVEPVKLNITETVDKDPDPDPEPTKAFILDTEDREPGESNKVYEPIEETTTVQAKRPAQKLNKRDVLDDLPRLGIKAEQIALEDIFAKPKYRISNEELAEIQLNKLGIKEGDPRYNQYRGMLINAAKAKRELEHKKDMDLKLTEFKLKHDLKNDAFANSAKIAQYYKELSEGKDKTLDNAGKLLDNIRKSQIIVDNFIGEDDARKAVKSGSVAKVVNDLYEKLPVEVQENITPMQLQAQVILKGGPKKTPDSVQKDLANGKALAGEVAVLMANIKAADKSDFGVFGKAWHGAVTVLDALGKVPASDKEKFYRHQERASKLSMIVSAYVKMISGAAATDQERATLEKQISTEFGSKETAEIRLNTLLGQLRAYTDALENQFRDQEYDLR
jgi:hypothetical protein